MTTSNLTLTLAGALILGSSLLLASATQAADLDRFDDVPAAMHQFVHPLDEVAFNPQPEPPADPRLGPATDSQSAIGLLLPAVQAAREQPRAPAQ